MQEQRKHNRIGIRMAIGVYCGDEGTRHACHTRDICASGLFAEHLTCPHSTDTVRIQIGLPDGNDLTLNGRIARTISQGIGLQFYGNGDGELQKLSTLLTPEWQGSDLLDGVVSIAPWYADDDLADWMRLTTIVSNWRRLKHR